MMLSFTLSSLLSAASLLLVPAGPDVTAEFSDPATEATVGVFLEVNPIKHGPSDSASFFGGGKFGMRRFVLGTAGLDSGGFTLSQEIIYGTGPLIEVFDEAGNQIELPA